MKNGRINFNTDDIVKIAEKSKNRCAKCGSQNSLHIHHIIPISKGGSNEIENLILLCALCHKLIHKNKSEFYDEQKHYDKYFCGEGYISSKEYNHHELGWEIETDCTDHFNFKCPKCDGEAAIESIFIRDYSSLRTPPCFYIKLKCHKCKLVGQRKIYLNVDISIIDELKEEESGK